MRAETPDAPARDWRDGSTYRPLFQLDRAAVDLAFARRHAEMAGLPTSPVRERLLRPNPPIRVLTVSGGEPPSRGLRFRRRFRHRPCFLARGSGSDGAASQGAQGGDR